MNKINYLKHLGENSKKASRVIANLSSVAKKDLLIKIAGNLLKETDQILKENQKDLQTAEENKLSKAMIDRLLLTEDRIKNMATSIVEIAELTEPIGQMENMQVRPSGIRVGQMRVPIGVLAVIFESRPNVTTDLAALSIKSGNAVILRGGKESIHSNLALYEVILQSLKELGYPEGIVTLITKTDRDLVPLLLKMNEYIDLVIPRGGEGLIKMVTQETNIPIIKHDKGLCHIFVDESAEEEMANNVVLNAKVQRPGVCNAVETLLIHEKYKNPKSLLQVLLKHQVEIRGCLQTVKLLPKEIKEAQTEDWDTEYLDLIISVRIVDSLETAMKHIERHSSNHSEAIITSNYFKAEKFVKEVDSSAVFVNASTRFHDGGEFGLGAEVGISTQKLHARGAMGIKGLTTLKYVVRGEGEIR